MLVKEFLNMKQFLVVFEIICFRKDPTTSAIKNSCLKNMVETKVVHNEFFFI